MRTLLVTVLTGICFATTPLAHAEPPCAAPPPAAQTPECHACVMAHLVDRDGLYRDCLGQQP